MTVSKDRQKKNPPKHERKAEPPPPSRPDGLGGISFMLSENRWAACIFIVLFAILSFLHFPGWGGGDYDIWWHFALGKYYVSHHTTQVNHALFSWTPADPSWLYNTWLGSTFVYLVYTAAGGFGLWLFQWAIFAGIFLCFLFFVRSVQGRLDINAVVLMLMTVMIAGIALVFPKPDLFTPLCFAALVSVFFAVKRNRISPKYFYAYPAMFVLWVNLHGGFIMGAGVVGLLFVTEWLNHFVVKRDSLPEKGLFHMGCSLALVLLACFINPYGWAYPWDTITVTFPVFRQLAGEGGSLSSDLIAYLPIWPYLIQPLKLAWWGAGWGMVLMLSLFLIVSLAAYRKTGFWDISLLLLNPFLFYFGMQTARACVFFPMFAFFSIFYIAERAGFLEKAKRFTLISVILFLCLGSVMLVKLTETPSFNFFGMNLQETVPVQEVELIKKWKLPPPLFNDYVSGGYMMWAMYPDYKVFVDSRGKPYDLTNVLGAYSELMDNPTRENLLKLQARYPFRVALINLIFADTILGILNNAPDEWRLLYFDRNAAVLVHRSVWPSLSGDLLRSIDMDPRRFRDVASPETLSNLFLLYIDWSSRHGAVIRDIYAQNVSRFYRHKKEQLAVMDEIIGERMAMERQNMPFRRPN